MGSKKSGKSKKNALKMPGVDWWAELGADVLEGNRLSVVKTLGKLPKAIRGEEINDEIIELDKAINEHLTQNLEKVSNPLPIEPDLTLWGVYVTPSAEYWSNVENPKSETTPDFLLKLKKVIEVSTSPIVVHGQPGHGKTSSMRMLAQVKVLEAKAPDETLLFYEFKNLGDLNAPELKSLQKETPFLKDESFFYNRKTILILDGMDERQITDGTNQHLSNFIRNIFRLGKKINKISNSRLNIIFTGRTLFIEQIKSSFIEPHHQFQILDFEDYKIDKWLKNFNDLKNLKSPLTRKTLINKQLGDLISQPILLTISSRVVADPLGIELLKDIPEEKITRSRIYEIIISWTYQKKHHDEKGIHNLPPEHTYTRFLKMVAYLIFRKGGESISIKELAHNLGSRREFFQLEKLFSSSLDIQEVIKDLAVGFFFEGQDEKAFAFIHKSVQDYLTVEAIFTLLGEAIELYNLEKTEKSSRTCAEDVYYILGKNAMSKEDHLPFLLEILTQRGESNFQKKLISFLEESVNHHFFIKHENRQNDNPITTEFNVLSALTYWIFGFPLPVEKRLEIESIVRLSSIVNSNFGFYFKDANLENAKLPFCFLPDSNFMNTFLEKADFYGALLERVNFQNSNCMNSRINMASLAFSNFKKANLCNSRFVGANLFGVIFIESNLKKSDFTKSSLENANFALSDLEDAIFHLSVLKEANFENANLTNADLTNADLSGLKNWKSASWNNANIFGVVNAPKHFSDYVLSNGGISVDRDQQKARKSDIQDQK